MKRGRSLTRTTVNVGSDQLAELRTLADRTGIAMGHVIRRGIDLALEDYRGRDPGCGRAGSQTGVEIAASAGPEASHVIGRG
jgi:Ribbon-helix-helix domain